MFSMPLEISHLLGVGDSTDAAR